MHEFWTQAAPLALSLLAGGVLGAIFFGGLWWTVCKSVVSAQPALWIFTSLVVRMGIALLGFYFVAGTQWQRWLACLLGFFGARLMVAQVTRSRANQAIHPIEGTRNASESR